MSPQNQRLNLIEEHLQAMMGVQLEFPFGPEPKVFKVAGKMFAWTAVKDGIPVMTVKASPGDVAFLIDEFQDITPGYHMNKRHWVTVRLNGQVEQGMLEDLATTSYTLVVRKLTKAKQKSLGFTE
ncbi:MmcQ/YjbR family DNA-binding protein [Photobacterium sp. 1_MG-2023]|uniref:MmcQ/YjbR family DNA-binding protein n=1 Tax=Photobacterium sp. 1_MG-2023 TaxID=3062646 RepID=UPI0026E202AB|nr:MmcQ/YjbR family DNA-binding protein [Photobacterium sp. 1_MG-2023]MDO6705366.1 MmcQ/YjbR family DNA-binding protein [Photobacterium sp. 1_MG-2023]